MITAGKATGKSGGSFAALKQRLMAGKGAASKISTMSRSNKTAWNKTGRKTFAVPSGKT